MRRPTIQQVVAAADAVEWRIVERCWLEGTRRQAKWDSRKGRPSLVTIARQGLRTHGIDDAVEWAVHELLHECGLPDGGNPDTAYRWQKRYSHSRAVREAVFRKIAEAAMGLRRRGR